MKDIENYDLVIVGAGVIGSFVARHLSRKKLKVAVFEKEDDICCGVSKAHTAIVHCGYSGKPGSLKGEMTVRANLNFHNVCKELDVEFKRCGSIITAKADGGMEKLNEKLDRGKKNGVPGLEFLNREETLEKEPNISDEVIASVYAPTTGVANPWEYCVAAMENAMDNGAELFLNTEVVNIEYIDGDRDIFVKTNRGNFKTKYLINCAGLYADKINNMVEDPFFKVAPRKGEYIVLDKDVGKHINGFIFQAREKDDPKGVIVSPTIHGNLMVGPSSEDTGDKEDCTNTIEGLEYIKKISGQSIKNIPFEKTIAYFAGIRPRPNWIRYDEYGNIEGYEDKVKDFIIGRGKKNKNFINVAGIKSPGFTCADEIGKHISDMIEAEVKEDFKAVRRKRIRTEKLSDFEHDMEIEKNPDYGEVICACNMITKGEIVDTIERNAGAKTIGGVKRRTSASMGRCHGSRCKHKIGEIIEKKDKSVYSKCDSESADRDMMYDTIIIGGGIAGISLAIKLIEKGIKSIAIVEREEKLGGILKQCIHHGFGVKHLNKNMTGPQYLNYFIDRLEKLIDENPDTSVNIFLNSEASSLVEKENFEIRIINRRGVKILKGKSVVMATGCIERHIGGIFLNGFRVKGIYTAGEAQRIINIEGKALGKRAVIIGSGDIGLIMARRMHLEGIEVVAIIEKNDDISGLKRNKSDCVDVYGIPIEFNSRIVSVLGKKEVEGIEFTKDGKIIKIDCDTVVTSVGLEPDYGIELSERSSYSCSHIFKLGNADYVHDLVDDITIESEKIAEYIISFIQTGEMPRETIIRAKKDIYYNEEYDIICTVCPEGCAIQYKNDMIIGNRCPRGRDYAIAQRECKRIHITTMIDIEESSKRAAVSTTKPVKLEEVKETMKLIKSLKIFEEEKGRDVERLLLKNGKSVCISFSREVNSDIVWI